MAFSVFLALHVCHDLTVMMCMNCLRGCPQLTAVLCDVQQLWQLTRNGVLSTLRFVMQQDPFHHRKHDRLTMGFCCT